MRRRRTRDLAGIHAAARDALDPRDDLERARRLIAGGEFPLAFKILAGARKLLGARWTYDGELMCDVLEEAVRLADEAQQNLAVALLEAAAEAFHQRPEVTALLDAYRQEPTPSVPQGPRPQTRGYLREPLPASGGRAKPRPRPGGDKPAIVMTLPSGEVRYLTAPRAGKRLVDAYKDVKKGASLPKHDPFLREESSPRALYEHMEPGPIAISGYLVDASCEAKPKGKLRWRLSVVPKGGAARKLPVKLAGAGPSGQDRTLTTLSTGNSRSPRAHATLAMR